MSDTQRAIQYADVVILMIDATTVGEAAPCGSRSSAVVFAGTVTASSNRPSAADQSVAISP